MRITAKLAYSQLKINRSRTIWTIIGIVLSTALITAVCSFAASGGALVIDLYGEDSGAAVTLLLIPVGILSVIIISISVIVISNAFRISAGERTAQFGILKSVGTTKLQITATAMYESILLSAVGIPIGIIIGLIIAFTGVGVANRFLEEINSLVHIMIYELIIVIDFVIAWQALIAALLISFFTVLLSAWLPARKAAQITAIESIRGIGEVKADAKQVHTSRLTERLFGFEGTLAAKNMKRNKHNFRASVVSLTIGVVLFINLSALSQQADTIGNMMYPDVGATVMVDYTSLRSTVINEATGREETNIIAPVDSAVAEIVTEKLREYEDAVIFCAGDDMDTYDAIVPSEMISSQMMEGYFYPEDRQEYEAPAEIITVDKENYSALCERAGVPVGSNILLNHYSYNDNGKVVSFAPFLCEGQEVRLLKADGSIREVPIHGVLTQENIPNELLPPNTQIVRLIVPQGEMRGFTWYASPTDIDGFIEYANVVISDIFPQGDDSSYMGAGFNTSAYKIQDYMKVMNIAIVLGTVFVYSFVVLLMLIGLTSVISTMSTNVRMRSREFAVLQSVGMTRSGLKRMLNLESIMCSAKSLIIGLPLAIMLTYLINLPIRTRFPVPYQFPWLAVAGCIAAVFLITWITMRYSVSRLRGKNVIETIRSASGM